MKKRVKIVFLNEKLEREYLGLSNGDQLKKRITHVIERLKENPLFGRTIAKRLILKEYIVQGISSLYWVELSKRNAWSLVYTLASEDKDDIVAIIVEWFTRHKNYERKFRY